jgi:hypothetical protein
VQTERALATLDGMRESDAETFETIFERDPLWLRFSWFARALVKGSAVALAALAAFALLTNPPSRTREPSWVAPLLAGAFGLWWLRGFVRDLVAAFSATRETIATISSAKELTHSGQRASYTLWHVMIDGFEHAIEPRALKGSGAARLRPGQRVAVRVVGSTLVRLAVDKTMTPLPVGLKAPIGEPAPLSEQDIARVLAWATRRIGIVLVLLGALVAMLVATPGAITVLHVLLSVLAIGPLFVIAGDLHTIRAVRRLGPGAPTRWVAGDVRLSPGLLSRTFVGGEELSDAAVPRAPRLASKARARVIAVPRYDSKREALVALEWVDATGG